MYILIFKFSENRWRDKKFWTNLSKKRKYATCKAK